MRRKKVIAAISIAVVAALAGATIFMATSYRPNAAGLAVADTTEKIAENAPADIEAANTVEISSTADASALVAAGYGEEEAAELVSNGSLFEALQQKYADDPTVDVVDHGDTIHIVHPFALKRLIVKDDIGKIDTSGTSGTAYSPRTSFYYLTYPTEEATAVAYAKLSEQYPDKIGVDIPVTAMGCSDSNTYDGWGVDGTITNLVTAEDEIADENISKRVTVAVLDTGCLSTHIAFSGATFSSDSKNFITQLNKNGERTPAYPDSDWSSLDPHGTFCASIVASAIPNKNLNLMILRVLDAGGEGSIADCIEAIAYAHEKKADVVSMSLGVALGDYSKYPSWVNDANANIKEYSNDGTIYVVAAGNKSSDSDANKTWPACSADTFTIGALKKSNGSVAFDSSYSNYGQDQTFTMPGTYVTGAGDSSNTSFYTASGTSMATPLAAAFAADLKLIHSDWNTDQVREGMKNCSEDLGDEGWDEKYGYGMPVWSSKVYDNIDVEDVTYRIVYALGDGGSAVDENGNTIAATSYSVKKGDPLPHIPSIPVKVDTSVSPTAYYYFAGWQKVNGYSYSLIQDDNLPATATQNVVYYAKWYVGYKVEYVLNGGTTTSNQTFYTCKKNSTTPPIDEPTREGYEFQGWSPAVSNTVTGNTTYSAMWRKDCAVTFNLNGGQKADTQEEIGTTSVSYLYQCPECGTSIEKDTEGTYQCAECGNYMIFVKVIYRITYEDQGQNTGVAHVIDDPVYEGYRFVGWQTPDGQVYQVSDLPSFNVAEDVEFTAQWEKEYSLYYNANYGDAENVDSGIRLINGETTATATALEREGYTFDGWSLTVSGDTQYAASSTIQLDSNLIEYANEQGEIVLYACWTPNKYRIWYDGGDEAIGNMNPDTDEITYDYVYDESKALAPNQYVRTGYTFVGWSTTKNGTTEYKDGDQVLNLTAQDKGKVTLYAVWKPIEYTVVFDANGGTGTMDTIPCTYDKTGIVFPECKFEHKGYAFSGWEYGQTYQVGTELKNLTTIDGTTITVKAIWIENFTVSFYDGENFLSSFTCPKKTVIEEKNVPPTPSHSGKRFVGWKDQYDNLLMIGKDQVLEDTCFYAYYISPISVIFNANEGTFSDGSTEKTVSVYTDDTISSIEGITVSQDGKTFAGWYTDENCTAENKVTKITEACALYAKWIDKPYTLTYNLNGGNINGSRVDVQFQSRGITHVPEDPTREGYKFSGWSPDITEMVTSDMTYYAQWTQYYDVSYDLADGRTISNETSFSVLDGTATPTIDDPVRTGYTFIGWKDEEGNSKTTDEIKTENVYSDKIYTAQWALKQYSITYDLDDGSWGDKIGNATYTIADVDYTLPTSLTKFGYSFTGWIDEDGNQVTTIYASSVGDRVYKATWKANQYNITYKDVDGTIIQTVPADYGSETPVINSPSYDDRTFTGWVPCPYDTKVTGDAVYTATYECTVIYDLKGGSTVNGTQTSFTVSYGTACPTIETPTRAGYEFNGWSPAVTSPVTSSVTYEAQWLPYYTVTYNLNGGVTTSNRTVFPVLSGKETPEINEPTKDGYTFTGWSPSIAETVTGDITYTAQWNLVPKYYTVTYDLNGGITTTATTTYIVKSGSVTPLINEPTKNGYKFVGWSPSIETTVTADVTYVAQWTQVIPARTIADGEYVIRTALSSTMALDIAGVSKANGANAQIWTANYCVAQRFDVKYDSSTGYYTICNVGSGKYLTATGGTRNCGNIDQRNWTGASSQKWLIVASTSGTYVIKSAMNTNYVMDIYYARTGNGTNLQMHTYNGSNAQKYKFSVVNGLSSGTYRISVAGNTSKSLDICGVSSATGANAWIWSNNNSGAQSFKFIYKPSMRAYIIINTHSGKALDVCGGQAANGTNVWQWDRNNLFCQQWSVVNVDGKYVIASGVCGYVLDIAGGNIYSNGTNVQIWSSNNTAAQRWYIK